MRSIEFIKTKHSTPSGLNFVIIRLNTDFICGYLYTALSELHKNFNQLKNSINIVSLKNESTFVFLQPFIKKSFCYAFI